MILHIHYWNYILKTSSKSLIIKNLVFIFLSGVSYVNTKNKLQCEEKTYMGEGRKFISENGSLGKGFSLCESSYERNIFLALLFPRGGCFNIVSRYCVQLYACMLLLGNRKQLLLITVVKIIFADLSTNCLSIYYTVDKFW